MPVNKGDLAVALISPYGKAKSSHTPSRSEHNRNARWEPYSSCACSPSSVCTPTSRLELDLQDSLPVGPVSSRTRHGKAIWAALASREMPHAAQATSRWDAAATDLLESLVNAQSDQSEREREELEELEEELLLDESNRMDEYAAAKIDLMVPNA
eukprot:CAMPEP_0119320376 /NCGR_PEP_ID=MMETSP1333-20130426/52271_1 /TAXON_ID=418940 /ORGANISM="Scyphosphaera apsteinii, Strain RCC1455" /LENGTH=154 /DNA_ID=CAMNT_0007327085 /DNA_START=121 /DNA_END=582 /DNA_ORIENTATION=+